MSLTTRLAFSILPVVLALVGIGMAISTYRSRRRAETIEATDRTAVEDLQPGSGLAAVVGEARPLEDRLLTAHLLGTEGVARVTTIQRRRGRAHDHENHTSTTSRWVVLYSDSKYVPFAVDDGTGEVAIHVPNPGRIALETEDYVVGPDEDPPGSVRELIDRIDGLEPAPGETRRYAQGVVEVGDRVSVLGEPVVDDDGRSESILAGDRRADEFVVSDVSKGTLADAESHGRAGYVLGALFFLAGAVPLGAIWLV
ncbi:MAG: hypothetical protein ACI9YT_002068 [Halobacteriales archaeon]|jgi:hypothetical protein